MDSGKALSIEAGFSRPSAVGPFESLAEELRVVRELATKLPQGPTNDPLSSSRPDESNDVPAQWSEDDDVDDSEATESDDNE
ncbi:hypothetical protein H5410_002491 [Solanum commersonii]|uniref:Uncharacterized protein n=1 Tax=Solanum commersonii TaxID=4109 RepID=A0A9J6B229_SOLCO|nr:hypothetical protein H5410_002491 [Solanum commersonii]